MILTAVGLFALGILLVLPFVLRRQQAKSPLPRWLMVGGVVLMLMGFIVAVAGLSRTPSRPATDSVEFEQTAPATAQRETTPPATFADPYVLTTTAIVGTVTAEANE